MRVAIFGLGYVGCVSAACLSRHGHDVICVDVNPTKVQLLNEGQSPIVEKEMPKLIAEGVTKGKLRATTDPVQAVAESEISFSGSSQPAKAEA